MSEPAHKLLTVMLYLSLYFFLLLLNALKSLFAGTGTGLVYIMFSTFHKRSPLMNFWYTSCFPWVFSVASVHHHLERAKFLSDPKYPATGKCPLILCSFWSYWQTSFVRAKQRPAEYPDWLQLGSQSSSRQYPLRRTKIKTTSGSSLGAY